MIAIIAIIATMLNPASDIIEKCGGFRAVATMVGRSEVRVRRWTYPKAKGGTGGLIPADIQPILMREARAKGVDLRPDDFFLADAMRPVGEGGAA